MTLERTMQEFNERDDIHAAIHESCAAEESNVVAVRNSILLAFPELRRQLILLEDAVLARQDKACEGYTKAIIEYIGR